MNHTPGPWKHGEGVCNHKVYSVAQPEKDEIVRCYGDTPEEAEANARLIAAAPEMEKQIGHFREVNAQLLKALIAARGMLTPKQQRSWPKNYERICTAIKAAGG